MNELKRLLEEGCTSDSRMAAQIRMLARAYITEAEKREAEFEVKEVEFKAKEAEFEVKEVEFKAKEAEFKAKEEKYLAEIVSLTNQNFEKDKFFSIVAHDLRGPLANFLGLSQVMMEDIEDISIKDLQKLAEGMNVSAKNLFQLLGNLLEWSKVRTNKTTLNLKVASIFKTMIRVENLYIDSAMAKGVIIESRVPTDSTFKCDDNIIETVLRNLVGNAVKFCSKGNKITVSAKKIGEEIEFSVADTGIGIKKEMVQKLFCLGSNVQRPGTAGELSTGLGLLLCKEFVELHGGKIWAESEEGVGSTFYFTIPLNLSSEQNPSSETAPHGHALVAN